MCVQKDQKSVIGWYETCEGTIDTTISRIRDQVEQILTTKTSGKFSIGEQLTDKVGVGSTVRDRESSGMRINDL